MSEILDNQEVTAEILNDIAIDLGMAEFNGFGENKFGVEDLNNITKDLAGKGVLATKDECRLSFIEGVLYISPGVVVFESGAKLRIVTPASVEIDSTQRAYVYAVHDNISNKIILNVLYEPMNTGDYFLFCEIENGILYDKRTFSRSKVLPLGAVPIQAASISGGLSKYAEGLICSIPLTNPTPSIIIFRIHIVLPDDGTLELLSYGGGTPMFAYYVSEQKYLQIHAHDYKELGVGIVVNTPGVYPVSLGEYMTARVEIEGGYLNIYGKNSDNMYRSINNYDVEII